MSQGDPLTSSPPHVEYLLPRMESFWRWSDDGRAVEWRDGRTIAFRAEVLEVLRRLAPSGLPPFGAIVLLLAATRDNWNEIHDKAERIFAGYSITKEAAGKAASPLTPVVVSFSAVVPHRARQELADVLGDLEAVASLPSELRTTVVAKAMIAELVFDGAMEMLDPTSGAALISLLEGGVEPATLQRIAGWDEKYEVFAEELEALQRGLGSVAAEPLSLLMGTGIDRTVQPAELELPAAQRVRGFIRDLRNDTEFAGLAKLARDLLAAIHIPRALVSPEDLPVGGVSDISNRGPLDRLLVSELAQEDLTLVIRIALGEALYLRRESPAQHPPIGRALLIDCGIRMWGVPRLYATAVAMALVALSDQRGHVSVHRTRGSIIERVDLFTRTGLIDHLGVLGPAPQPGAALELFLLAADSVKDQETELFLITHERVLDDPQFQRQLRSDPNREWNIATVADDGSFALWLISRAGRRQLCRASLSLESLLSEPRPNLKPPAITVGAEFPEIERLPRFPLLLPAKLKPSRCAASASIGLVGITGDRRLMYWADSYNQGGRQILSRLPKGQVLGVVLDDNNRLAHALIHRGERRKLHIISATLDPTSDAPVVRQQSFDMHRRPLHILCRDGWIYMFQRQEAILISSPGDEIRKHPIPTDMHWRMGRYLYQTARGWHAATPEGFQFLTRVPAIAVFDHGKLGPWLIKKNGEVVPSDEAVESDPKANFNITFLGASTDGERVFARYNNTTRKLPGVYRYDFSQRAWLRTFDSMQYVQSILLCEGSLGNEPFNIRNRFGAINVSADGRLFLFNRHHSVECLFCPQEGPITLQSVSADGAMNPRAAFRRTSVPPGVRYSMRLAEWVDGSRAILDSRGLLHLVSSDTTLPQITLALSTGLMAAWTSAGHRIGASYFFGEAPNATTQDLLRLLQEFARRLK